jgi:hypothetical protein
VRAAKFKCAHHVHSYATRREAEKEAVKQGAWGTGGAVYDLRCRNARAVRAGNLREAKQHDLETGGLGHPVHASFEPLN